MAKLKYNFVSAARDYGLRRIFLSVSFIGATLLALAFASIVFVKPNLPASFVKQTASDVQAVAIGIFPILFAGFAIVISLSEENFVKFLQRKKVFVRVLFPFWFDSALYLLATLAAFLSTWFEGRQQVILTILSVWIILWALIDTFYLVMSTVLFGHYRAEFIEYRKEIEAELAENEQKPPRSEAEH